MMKGKTTWNGAAVHREIVTGGAVKLIAAAVMLQTRLMLRVGISNPKPYVTSSVDGEYLRKRTGWLQAHILYEPTAPDDVARQGSVRVGYGASAFYGAIWEIRKRRKGLLDALKEIMPELKAMMARK